MGFLARADLCRVARPADLRSDSFFFRIRWIASNSEYHTRSRNGIVRESNRRYVARRSLRDVEGHSRTRPWGARPKRLRQHSKLSRRATASACDWNRALRLRIARCDRRDAWQA